MVLDQLMVDENISPLALAGRLRQALDLSDKSQRHLADLFGISDAAVSKWLKSGKIGRDKLPVIANFLGVTLKWLASGEGPMRAELEEVAPDEREMLRKYRALSQKGKDAAQTLLEISASNQLSVISPLMSDDARRIA